MQELKLTDFPYSNPGFGRRVTVVAVGSAGCTIASQLSNESRLLEHFVYISCDEHDLASVTKGDRVLIDTPINGKTSPYVIRGLAHEKLPEIRRKLQDSEVVLIISGLGGMVGSGLAPLVACEASPKRAVTLAILVMPSSFQHEKHFFAGSALKQIRKHVAGVIIVDNDELRRDVPLIDSYAETNQKIALALNKLLGTPEQHEFSIGLSNVVRSVMAKSYSVLSIGDSVEHHGYRDAVMNAARGFDATVDVSQASKSLVHLCADKSITMNELITSIGGLSGVLGDGTMQIEYGLSASSTTPTSTAIIVATGFTSTKFDSYDPVDAAIRSKGENLDSDMDGFVNLESLVPNVERD